MRKSDFIAIFTLNTILVGLIALGGFSTGGLLGFFRIVLSFAYLLFVPGYALQAALLPRQGHLASLDRFALSVGLSLAIMPILGLVLDGPFGGIFVWQSVIFLTGLTLVCAVIALYRRQRMTADENPTGEQALGLHARWMAQAPALRRLFVLFSVIIAAATLLVVFVLAAPSPNKYFTEFYIVSPTDVAENYPLQVTSGRPFPIRLGIVNQEGSMVTYSIKVQMSGQPLAGTAPFTLNDGQSTPLDLNVAVSTPGDHQQLEILLLRDNQTYRRLYLWLDVKSP